MIEVGLVGVRSLLFPEVGGLCDVLSPAMMASTCINTLDQQRHLQGCASSLCFLMAGKAWAMAYLRLLSWLLCIFRAKTSPSPRLSLICWWSCSGGCAGEKGLTDTERGLSGPSARYWQRCRSAGNTSWIGLRSLEDCDPEAAFACSPRRRLLNLSTEFRSVASAALLSRDLAEIALIG